MWLKISPKACRPRLRELLLETLELARVRGIDPTNLEILVYGAPAGKRNFGVFQYVFGRTGRDGRWQTLNGRILLQPRQGATDREIVRLLAHELGHLRDFQDQRACCLMDRRERELRPGSSRKTCSPHGSNDQLDDPTRPWADLSFINPLLPELASAV